MRWVLMLFVVLAAVMGGEAGAVVVCVGVTRQAVSDDAGLADTRSMVFWLPDGWAVVRSGCGGTTTWAASYQADGRRTAEAGTNVERHLQTFISRDPLGLVDGPNVYAYVEQNPWSAFDPEGLASPRMQQVTATGYRSLKLFQNEKTMKPIHFAALISALFASASCTSPNTMRTPRNYHFEISNALQIDLEEVKVSIADEYWENAGVLSAGIQKTHLYYNLPLSREVKAEYREKASGARRTATVIMPAPPSGGFRTIQVEIRPGGTLAVTFLPGAPR